MAWVPKERPVKEELVGRDCKVPLYAPVDQWVRQYRGRRGEITRCFSNVVNGNMIFVEVDFNAGLEESDLVCFKLEDVEVV